MARKRQETAHTLKKWREQVLKREAKDKHFFLKYFSNLEALVEILTDDMEHKISNDESREDFESKEEAAICIERAVAFMENGMKGRSRTL